MATPEFQPESTKPREISLMRLAVSLLVTIAIFVVPFLSLIEWRDGGYGEERSMIVHAIWWWNDAPFGPWPGPLVVVLGPPLLVVATIVSPTWIKRFAALITVAAAWACVIVAAAGVGEDIVFTWYHMTFPLTFQAVLITVWWTTRRWWIVPIR